MEPGESVTDLANPISLVNAGVVPDHDDVAAEMAEEMSQEGTHLAMPDVVLVRLEVEPDASAVRCDTDAGDHGDSIVTVAVPHHGRMSTRGPGLANRWNQEEARLVGEDDMGTQPRSVFFTRGHSFLFHCSIASSSRFSARRSGFWWLHPSPRISRPM
jgi:hypothetical protein